MAGVEDMAQHFWATRPRRPRRGRKIAGVAAGIANRYRIDPTLVRVGLVVAAVYGGAGIVVYLLGWLFLPEQDDEVSPFESMIGRGRSSTSSVFTLLLCAAFIPTFSWFFNGFAPGYLSLLVVAGVLYLLHRNRGHLGQEPPAGAPMPEMAMPTMPTMPMQSAESPTMATSTGATTGATVPLPDEVTETPAATSAATSDATPDATPAGDAAPEPEPRTGPPAWDPLGAAPFAWDLPDPNPPLDEQEPEPPLPRRRSRIGLVTVGIALIAAAGMSMAMGGWIDAQHIVGVVLAVLGLGMVAGSFVRGGRGLIGLAVPLSVIGIGLTVVSPEGWNGFGDIDVKPATTSAVEPEYSRSVGSIQLDLADLPNQGEVETKIDLGVGDVSVWVPQNADVYLHCHTDIGSVDCLGQVSDGVNNEELPEITDFGLDDRGGLEVHMTIDVGTGSVEVRRG